MLVMLAIDVLQKTRSLRRDWRHRDCRRYRAVSGMRRDAASVSRGSDFLIDRLVQRQAGQRQRALLSFRVEDSID